MNVKEFKKKAILYLGFLWFSLTLWPFYLIGAHEYNGVPIQDPGPPPLQWTRIDNSH